MIVVAGISPRVNAGGHKKPNVQSAYLLLSHLPNKLGLVYGSSISLMDILLPTLSKENIKGEITGSGLISIQCIITTWQNSAGPSNCGLENKQNHE